MESRGGLINSSSSLCQCVGVSPHERVVSLHLQVGEQVLTVVCTYEPNSSSEYPTFFESLEKVVESAPYW